MAVTEDHKIGLTQEQENALGLLLTGLCDREVAEQVGVARETVTRWRNENPYFEAELNRRRQELWAEHAERLRGMVGPADVNKCQGPSGRRGGGPKPRRGVNAEGLNPKQARFVEAYTGGGPKKCLGNGMRSAIWAGYAASRAASTASRMMANHGKVQAGIAKRQTATAEAAQVTRDGLVRRLLELSDLKFSDILYDDGSLKPVSEWPEAADRSVQGLDVVTQRGEDGGGVHKVRIEPRGQNLARVAKLLGLLTERVGDLEGKPLAPGVIYLPRGA